MATSRTTVASLLGTVTTAANAVTSTFDNIDRGLSMLTKSIAKHQAIQSHKIRDDLVVSMQTINNETIIRLAESAINVDQFLNKSAEHKSYFTQYESKLAELRTEADKLLGK